MATEVFGRKYALFIGTLDKLVANETVEDILNKPDLTDRVVGGSLRKNSDQEGYRDYVSLPPEGNGIEITDLHIETNVELRANAKSSVSSASVSIRIFNMSKNTQKKIKAEDTVILRAGYEQDEELPLIFAGQIVTIKTRREGVNVVTTLSCGDSFTPRKNLRVSKSYPRGTSKKDIIQDLLNQAADYGVPTGQFFVPTSSEESGLASIISTVDYNPAKGFASSRVEAVVASGYAVFGLLFEELARTCDNIDFRSYLLQGSLYVEPIEYRIKQTTIKVTGDSIIGSIREEDDGSTNITGDKLKQRGITLKVPLNGRITTTSLVKVSDIEDDELSGDYAVVSLKHTLSLERGDWVTEISCKRVL